MSQCEFLSECDVAFHLKFTGDSMYDYYCLNHPEECKRRRIMIYGISAPGNISPDGKFFLEIFE